MYKINPFYETNDHTGLDTITSSNRMYTVRPHYGGSTGPSSEELSKMDVFSRQELLITNIEAQIRRVDNLLTEPKDDIKVTPGCTSSTSSSSQVSPLKVDWPPLRYPVDIVVNVNPDKLPVTPWALRTLLGDSVMIRTHSHSTYKGRIPSVDNDNENANRTQGVKLIFTVIYKDVKECEVMIDPISQVCVCGEANLVRYLNRVFSLFSPSLSVFEETLSDYYVDLICSSLVSGNTKEQQNALKVINTQLGKQDLIVCGNVAAADFVLFAALQKCDQSLPSNVQKWQKTVAQVF